MRESRRRGQRRAKASAQHTDSKQMRAAFIINMFREFPDREFSLKQLVSASGGNTKEARYMVRDLVDALVEQGVVVRHSREKFQLSTSQLPHYEGTVDMVASGAAYVRVEEVSRNGFLYLTAKRLICHFRDKKPYTEVIFQKESNWRVKLLSPVSFHLSDTKHTFEVVSTDALSMAEKMQALGWSVTVAPEQEQI